MSDLLSVGYLKAAGAAGEGVAYVLCSPVTVDGYTTVTPDTETHEGQSLQGASLYGHNWGFELSQGIEKMLTNGALGVVDLQGKVGPRLPADESGMSACVVWGKGSKITRTTQGGVKVILQWAGVAKIELHASVPRDDGESAEHDAHDPSRIVESARLKVVRVVARAPFLWMHSAGVGGTRGWHVWRKLVLPWVVRCHTKEVWAESPVSLHQAADMAFCLSNIEYCADFQMSAPGVAPLSSWISRCVARDYCITRFSRQLRITRGTGKGDDSGDSNGSLQLGARESGLSMTCYDKTRQVREALKGDKSHYLTVWENHGYDAELEREGAKVYRLEFRRNLSKTKRLVAGKAGREFALVRPSDLTQDTLASLWFHSSHDCFRVADMVREGRRTKRHRCKTIPLWQSIQDVACREGTPQPIRRMARRSQTRHAYNTLNSDLKRATNALAKVVSNVMPIGRASGNSDQDVRDKVDRILQYAARMLREDIMDKTRAIQRENQTLNRPFYRESRITVGVSYRGEPDLETGGKAHHAAAVRRAQNLIRSAKKGESFEDWCEHLEFCDEWWGDDLAVAYSGPGKHQQTMPFVLPEVDPDGRLEV